MFEATQALSFVAGANGICTGNNRLTAANPGDDNGAAMLAKLRLVPREAWEPPRGLRAIKTEK